MHILALEPYYGGSHQAFLEGWQAHSRHTFTLLQLPPFKWKWRMRHAAITFADELRAVRDQKLPYDLLWCSDMLNLASFYGLAPPSLRALPGIVYFHENQLTYPVRYKDDRDYHFAFSNLTTALAADRVWFNSAYHRDSFLEALQAFCRKMPDYPPLDAIENIRAKSAIHPPGTSTVQTVATRPQHQPMHIVWAARWEFDKAPDIFFDAIDRLAKGGADFRLSVIGESFKQVPKVFAEAQTRHADRIVHWGYQESRAAYEAVLTEADVAVSTARHEFFGIGMLEAASAGAFPLVPRALAYPETLAAEDNPDFFYEGGAVGLAKALEQAISRHAAGNLWDGRPERAQHAASRYEWPLLARAMDDAAEAMTP